MESNAKKSAKNIVLAFSSQIVSLALGIILPRLLISGFGSEVNGFFSTVTQLYSYLEVLRAGVGMAAIQALYKPIVNDDKIEVSRIISASKTYFQRLGIVYLVCTAIITIVFSVAGNAGLSSYEIVLIVLMQGITGWINFSHIYWFVDLLRAEGKNYVFISIQTVGTILVKLLEIVMIVYTKNPVLVKAVALFIAILQYLAFYLYRKKEYGEYTFGKNDDYSVLKNRKSYLSFHISSLICTNTDVVVLSMFCGYAISSVYSIYSLVVTSVNSIINTIYSSTSYLLGHSYQRGMVEFKKTHDIYYLLYITLTSSLFAICYVLIIPFIKIYTSGISDVNYVYEWLPLLFCIIQILMCSKNVGDITINVAGLAPKVVWRSYTEAGLNIVLSLIFVQLWGIYGVLVGTVIALTYRLIDVLFFSNKYVFNRKPWKNLGVLICNLSLFAVVVLVEKYLSISINSFFTFLLYGLIISPIIIIVFFGVVLCVNNQERTIIIKAIRKKLKR